MAAFFHPSGSARYIYPRPDPKRHVPETVVNKPAKLTPLERRPQVGIRLQVPGGFAGSVQLPKKS